MEHQESRVTVHMVASLDGFIARKDGRVDWLETADEFPGGATLDAQTVEAVLKSIDCYVMGSKTYETALGFEQQGFGWAYGDKPVFVLTHRSLSRTRPSVELCAGDVSELMSNRLRPKYRSIWIVGGGLLCGECLRRGLVDVVRYSVLPVVIGEGIRFFENVDRDIALHLTEAKPYANGTVALTYAVLRKSGGV